MLLPLEVRRLWPPFVKGYANDLMVMARMYRTRPSQILAVDGLYEAWCLDQAIALYEMRLKNRDKLRPAATEDNEALIREILGGDEHGD